MITPASAYPVFSPGRGLAGFPQEKTEMAQENQEDAPVRAQGQATSQTDLSSFNGHPNTKAFCLSE